MKELISRQDIDNWIEEYELGLEAIGFMELIEPIINQRHEEEMKERALEFAEFWSAEHKHPESYYLNAEEAYNEKYGSDEQG